MAIYQIGNLSTIPQAPADADVLAIEAGGVTYKVSKSVLASAILAQLGGNTVTIAHGGTGATNAEDARENLGVPSNQEMEDAIQQSTANIKAVNNIGYIAGESYNLDTYYKMSQSGLYYVGANVVNSPADYAILIVAGSNDTESCFSGQLLIQYSQLFYRTRAGSPPVWGKWRRLVGTEVT